MLIERKHTADLIPADYNPRKDLKPGDPEYDKLKRSMEQFGYVEPVIWNKSTGRVVGGHQRLKVLMDMGVTEVECVVVEMDEEREKALNIALNKISGDWDKDKLMLLISDLQGADFDVSLTGFDPAEIDDLFKDSLKDGVKDDEFDVDAELQKPTITKARDVWTLGRHRLVCGDSTKPETFALLMEGLKSNLVITDPPYNVNYEGGAGKIKNDNCLNDQGGSCMDVSSEVAATLRAEHHGHLPCVLDAAGFCTEHSADSRGIGFEPERAPTLRAGVVPAAIALESHPIDSRIKIADDGTVQTLTSRMGTGGMNVPLVMKIRSGCEGGGKGPLIQEDKSATLGCNNDQALFEPVAFGISSDQSKAMLSSNPHAGIYKARTSRTLDTSGGNPGCNQGGIAVVYAMTTGSYAQVEKETSPTLMARDYKDPTAVNSGYTVRRLTPTECARLQGFPDWWCAGLETPEPTREDIAFWTEVWETHRRAVNPSVKPKTERQIVKWLKAPYSDAAEYKMWGNGVALPCVWFVLSGIVFSTQLSPA